MHRHPGDNMGFGRVCAWVQHWQASSSRPRNPGEERRGRGWLERVGWGWWRVEVPYCLYWGHSSLGGDDGGVEDSSSWHNCLVCSKVISGNSSSPSEGCFISCLTCCSWEEELMCGALSKTCWKLTTILLICQGKIQRGVCIPRKF